MITLPPGRSTRENSLEHHVRMVKMLHDASRNHEVEMICRERKTAQVPAHTEWSLPVVRLECRIEIDAHHLSHADEFLANFQVPAASRIEKTAARHEVLADSLAVQRIIELPSRVVLLEKLLALLPVLRGEHPTIRSSTDTNPTCTRTSPCLLPKAAAPEFHPVG